MILAYHEILPERSRRAYSLSCELLRRHLEACSDPGRASAKPVEWTFDDGHASQFHHGFPLLSEFGVRGVFFVTVGWTGARPDYMNWTHLRELAANGHRVEAHGWSHKLLTGCSASELEVELRRPKNLLEDKLGREVSAIAMPGGRWDRRVLEACRRAGYTDVYTSDPWHAPAAEAGLRRLGRLVVRQTMSAEDLRRYFASYAKGAAPAWWGLRMRRMVRRVVGDRIYQRAWRSLAGSAHP